MKNRDRTQIEEKNMISNIFEIIENPRKPNGDIGDLKCDFCECQTSAYVKLTTGSKICKGCLYDTINEINKVILK